MDYDVSSDDMPHAALPKSLSCGAEEPLSRSGNAFTDAWNGLF